MAQCAACAALAREAADFEGRVHEALLVPAPESLAERVLLRHTVRKPARTRFFAAWALAASLLVAVAAVLVLNRAGTQDAGRTESAVAAAGASDTALAVIAYVLDFEPQLLKDFRASDAGAMQSALERFGLTLPREGIEVRYLGKCPVPNGTGDHLVLQAGAGKASLILIPEQSLGPRTVVAFRDLTAAVSPRGPGSYIMVGDSLQSVEQFEKLLM